MTAMVPPSGAAPAQQSVSTEAARLLANTTKSAPQYIGSSPRWLVRLLPWLPLEAGTFRINRLKVVAPPPHLVDVDDAGASSSVSPESLHAVPALRSLSADALAAIADALVVEQYSAGASVMDAGDEPRFVIVAAGKVEASHDDPHGLTVRRALLGPGAHLGHEALGTHPTETPAVRAVTPATLLVLTRSAWERIDAVVPAARAAVDHALGPAPSVNEFGEREVDLRSGHEGEVDVPRTFIDYEENPREIGLNIVQTVLQVHTRVTDVYNSPFDQLEQQMRLSVEGMKERQEWDLVNDPSTGLLGQVAPSMRITTRLGAPTPDDLDEMLRLVWKEPAFFLAHPRAIAAFGRECTRRGVPPPTVQLHGSPFLTWRGVPLVPSDKLTVHGTGATSRTRILLMRVGEERQGVVGLHQPGLHGGSTSTPSLSVHFMGINQQAVASYLLTLYSSVAVMADDALAVLDDVEVGRYHDYE
jgi:hypothetical protein